MKIDTFANRLQKAMNMNNYKQVDLVNKSKLDKSLINKYLNGISEAGNDKLELLAKVLNVNEVWLMGYDVDIYGNPITKKEYTSELDLLYDKSKEILNDTEKDVIKSILKNAIKKNKKDDDND